MTVKEMWRPCPDCDGWLVAPYRAPEDLGFVGTLYHALVWTCTVCGKTLVDDANLSD